MKFESSFILQVPYTLLNKIPYAWMAMVFFWTRWSLLSGIFGGIVLLGLVMIVWQARAWEAKLVREFHAGKDKPFIDHPHIPHLIQLRNLVMLFLLCGVTSWVLKDRLDLNGLEWFALLAGTLLLYMSARLLGAPTTYILTDQGIGIRHIPWQVDQRFFFRYGEIKQAVRTKLPKQIPLRWEILIPGKYSKEGILVSSIRKEGFSKQIPADLFLTPSDIEEFLKHLRLFIAVS